MTNRRIRKYMDADLVRAIGNIRAQYEKIQNKPIVDLEAQRIAAVMLDAKVIVIPKPPTKRRRRYDINDALNVGRM